MFPIEAVSAGIGLLALIINLGLFARKDDLASLRAEVYEHFASRAELEAKFSRLEDKIDKLFDLIEHIRA